jgi:TolB protein
VVNLADGSFKDVDGGTYAFRPAWDPAQAWRIISDGGRGLLELDINRDYRQKITDEINDGSPVFSPDGRYLAVTMGQQGGGPGYDIYRLNANGTGRVRLTQTPLWETALPGNDKLWNNVASAWSPDGSQIVFLTDRTGRWEIWLMNADGSDQHPLFSDEINDQLQITYNFVDERVLSWR